jgi:hypothetical protein
MSYLTALARLLAEGAPQDQIRLHVSAAPACYEAILAAEIFGHPPTLNEIFLARNAVWEVAGAEFVKRLIAARLPLWGWRVDSPRFCGGTAYRAELQGEGFTDTPYFGKTEYQALFLAFVSAVLALRRLDEIKREEG